MSKNFNRYDNVDYDVVEVNKDTLLLKLRDCEKYASASNETLTYASIALTLFAAVFFTETSRGIWTISGETIQATFLVGGIATTICALYKAVKWYRAKGTFTPEAIIKSLTRDTNVPVQVLLPAPKQEPTKRRASLAVKSKRTVRSK
jgi:hypothetical protein